MWPLKFVKFIVVFAIFMASSVKPKKLMCYYDRNAYKREGIGQMSVKELSYAIPMCTHIVYGHIGINKKYGLTSLNGKVNLKPGLDYLKNLPSLNTSLANVKFYLSIGGHVDNDNPQRYLQVLNSDERRSRLINSIVNVASKNSFHGIDLAWKFPKERLKCNATSPNKFRGCFNYECAAILDTDQNSNEVNALQVDRLGTRNNFTIFLQELRKEANSIGLEIMLTILPYVNIEFFEVNRIKDYVNFVHLMSYDYENPYYSPNETRFWSIFRFQEKNCDPKRHHITIEQQVISWIIKGTNKEQIILGVPAYGRTWKIPIGGYDGPIKASSINADGPGPAGKYTKKDGMLSYYEICELLETGANRIQLKEYILSLGSAAFKTSSQTEAGLWLAYDNIHYLTERVVFTKELKLAGLAIMDLSLDDFKGRCLSKQMFPIVTAVKTYL